MKTRIMREATEGPVVITDGVLVPRTEQGAYHGGAAFKATVELLKAGALVELSRDHVNAGSFSVIKITVAVAA